MKSLATLSASLLLSYSLTTISSAAEVHQHRLQDNSKTKASPVYVVNKTQYKYKVYARYPYSSDYYEDTLQPYGYLDPYYVSVDDPVCLSAERLVDHYFFDMDCYYQAATVTIKNGTKSSKEKPLVRVEKS